MTPELFTHLNGDYRERACAPAPEAHKTSASANAWHTACVNVLWTRNETYKLFYEIKDFAEKLENESPPPKTHLMGRASPEYVAAEAAFTEYFVRNYPGPDTIIFDPKWHAPKLFAAATHALRAAMEGSDTSNIVERLRQLDAADHIQQLERENAELRSELASARFQSRMGVIEECASLFDKEVAELEGLLNRETHQQVINACVIAIAREKANAAAIRALANEKEG